MAQGERYVAMSFTSLFAVQMETRSGSGPAVAGAWLAAQHRQHQRWQTSDHSPLFLFNKHRGRLAIVFLCEKWFLLSLARARRLAESGSL
jgi:hypothetical protein